MSQKIHCSLSYHDEPIESLPTFANGVKQGIANNPTVFDPKKTPAPPLSNVQFDQLIKEEQSTYAAYHNGGVAQKSPFVIARAALMDGLDKTANYVDEIANGDANIIILAGYKPTGVAGGGIAAKMAQALAPTTVKVTNGASTGELNAECESFHAGHHYGCVVSEGVPLSSGTKLNAQGQLIIDPAQTNRIIIDVNNERKKKFTGLTKGIDYFFYFYVVNSGGVSPLSVVVDKMSL